MHVQRVEVQPSARGDCGVDPQCRSGQQHTVSVRRQSTSAPASSVPRRARPCVSPSFSFWSSASWLPSALALLLALCLCFAPSAGQITYPLNLSSVITTQPAPINVYETEVRPLSIGICHSIAGCIRLCVCVCCNASSYDCLPWTLTRRRRCVRSALAIGRHPGRDVRVRPDLRQVRRRLRVRHRLLQHRDRALLALAQPRTRRLQGREGASERHARTRAGGRVAIRARQTPCLWASNTCTGPCAFFLPSFLSLVLCCVALRARGQRNATQRRSASAWTRTWCR